MSINSIQADFQLTIAKLNALITNAHSANAAGAFVWSQDDRIVITESAFLRTFIAWETFLEKSFLHYLMGNTSISGKVHTCYAKPRDEEHGHQLLVGLAHHVDWSKPDAVRKLSKNFFDKGDPFDRALSSIASDISDLKTIRNATAHITSTTSKSLDGLATRKLQVPCRNITVYDLILAADPANPGKTILETYQDILQIAALQISQ